MNTTTTHVVEGTDLPAYESGLTDSGYLYLGGGVKLTIADRHVEYLRQLVVAAGDAIQRIEARGPKPEPAELQHPGTWLPGDRLRDKEGDEWTRDTAGQWTYDADRASEWDDRLINRYMDQYDYFRIAHLAPRKAGA